MSGFDPDLWPPQDPDPPDLPFIGPQDTPPEGMTQQEALAHLERMRSEVAAESAKTPNGLKRCIEGEFMLFLPYGRALVPGHIYTYDGIREARVSGCCEYHFDRWFQPGWVDAVTGEKGRTPAEEEQEQPVTTVEETVDFIIGYQECAIWSSTFIPLGEDGTGGEPVEVTSLDWVQNAYTVGELFTEQAQERTRKDCEEFIASHEPDLWAAILSTPDYSWSSAGHDFWLTRNGHGAGFWDRGLGEVGARLSEAAWACGGLDLLVLEEQRRIEFAE